MDRAEIANRLVQLRGGKTQREVAESLGISVSAMAMYEAGERVPRDEIKVKLANFYGCTVQSLFFA